MFSVSAHFTNTVSFDLDLNEVIESDQHFISLYQIYP